MTANPTPERMTPEAARSILMEARVCVANYPTHDPMVTAAPAWDRSGALKRLTALDEYIAALAQRVAELEARLLAAMAAQQKHDAHVALAERDRDEATARADALEKEAGRPREFVRRCSYAHLFPVDGLKLSSEAKAALSEPSDDTPTPSKADDHG